VYNFIRGVGYWDKPVALQFDGMAMECRNAISYSNEDSERNDHAHYYWTEEGLSIKCKTGWVCIENGTYSHKFSKLEG
jgi:hypothetical protein